MQEYNLYEYAIIRLVPRVERGEFVNIGSILYCSQEKLLQCVFHCDDQRLLALYPDLDLELVKRYSKSFELICTGDPSNDGIAGTQLRHSKRCTAIWWQFLDVYS